MITLNKIQYFITHTIDSKLDSSKVIDFSTSLEFDPLTSRPSSQYSGCLAKTCKFDIHPNNVYVSSSSSSPWLVHFAWSLTSSEVSPLAVLHCDIQLALPKTNHPRTFHPSCN